MTTNSTIPRSSIPLLVRVTCPHCWSHFPPEQALWIAQHPDLLNDPRLGADHPQRFLPTRFNVDGAALDSRGFPCHGLACPRCHLPVPRALFEMDPTFLSILGAPASGKSYFLAAMTWRLRQLFPKYFCLGFADADPISNHRLQEYEGLQFLNPNQNALVAIEKTETHGDLYDTVLYGDQAVHYPRPFLFTLSPLRGHPHFGNPGKGRAICVYDNAGESFLPGEDTASSPVTRHLAQSRVLFFLFDPTQDPRFREACHGKSRDPQMTPRTERLTREKPIRQETILHEAAQRVRRYAGLAQTARHSRPLIVVVTKQDSWQALLGEDRLPRAWMAGSGVAVQGMQIDLVEAISKRVRSLLWQLTPEIVAAAEGFAQQVLYIPVSATGGPPEIDPQTGAMGFRPKNIKPMWVEVPLLYSLSRFLPGLVPHYTGHLHRNGEAMKEMKERAS